MPLSCQKCPFVPCNCYNSSDNMNMTDGFWWFGESGYVMLLFKVKVPQAAKRIEQTTDKTCQSNITQARRNSLLS